MRKPKKFKDFHFGTYHDNSGWFLAYGWEGEFGGRESVISGWKCKKGLRDLILLYRFLGKVIKYIKVKQRRIYGR